MTTNKKLYAKRDIRGLGLHYTKHVSAMTSEELFFKSDIAAELAWRDMEIERLRAEKEAAEGQAAERERIKLLYGHFHNCWGLIEEQRLSDVLTTPQEAPQTDNT